MSHPDYSVGGPDGPREIAGLGQVPHQDKRRPNRRPRDSRKRRPAGPGVPAPAAPAPSDEAAREGPAPPTAPDDQDPHTLDTLA